MSGMIRKPRRLQRIPEMTETIRLEINLNAAKHPRICTVKSLEPDAKEMATTGPVSHLSPRSLQLIPTSRQTETETETENGIGADVSPPPRHAARHSAGPRRWFTGQAWKQQLAAPHESGSKSCLHSIRYFLPFRSLERAESCYARIKNKCSRNGPAGNAQQEAFAARPRAPAAKSNRYAQYFSTSSQITITHIQASTCSSENKEAPLSASTSIEAARLSVMKFSISPWVFQPCTAPWTSSRLPRCKVRRALQPPSLQITKDKLGDPAGPSQHRRQSAIFVLGWCSVWWLRAEKSTMVNYSRHIPARLQ